MALSEKKWVEQGRTILFVDESAIYLLPSVVRTWAPVGQTPVLREWVSRDHLSAIAAISEAGTLYSLHQEDAYNGDSIVGFLRHLQEEIRGLIGIVWDGARIHCGEAVKTFLKEGGSARIELTMLPSYSPHLNPVEGVWSYLKGVLLPNAASHTLAHLKQRLIDATKQMHLRPDIINGCFHQPDCYYLLT